MKRKNTRLRQIYNNMKYRCYAPNLDERTAKAYRDKGIRVCEEWLGYYGNFEAWALSNGYQSYLTIDRIDPNGNYCPENCRWITKSENCARARTHLPDREEKLKLRLEQLRRRRAELMEKTAGELAH